MELDKAVEAAVSRVLAWMRERDSTYKFDFPKFVTIILDPEVAGGIQLRIHERACYLSVLKRPVSATWPIYSLWGEKDIAEIISSMEPDSVQAPFKEAVLARLAWIFQRAEEILGRYPEGPDGYDLMDAMLSEGIQEEF